MNSATFWSGHSKAGRSKFDRRMADDQSDSQAVSGMTFDQSKEHQTRDGKSWAIYAQGCIGGSPRRMVSLPAVSVWRELTSHFLFPTAGF